MALTIQTNVNSLIAQENLRVNTQFQSQTIQRLTSGYRINQSGDDAAGLAIANKFRSSVAELTQGVRNANDGVSQLQIIDGGMENISKMLDRLKTLATQSASDSFTGDRGALNSEYQTLVGEINRQSEAIGLNTGGSFAKTLGIYIGGGSGSSDSDILANGSVWVDLSRSTVDAQSLGLTGVRAINQNPAASVSNDYDLGASSKTSVQAIVNDTNNTAGLATAGITRFTFRGPGFGDDSGITISVNLNGVGDTDSLVAAINAAIQQADNNPSASAAKFKAANITASMATDSLGRQQLSFNSSNAAFQVQADDKMANALMGNYVDAAVSAGGSSVASTLSSGGTVTATATTSDVTVTFTSPGGTNIVAAITITTGATAQGVVGTINTALSGTGISVTATAGGSFVVTSSNGDKFTMITTGNAGSLGYLGLTATTASSTFGFSAMVAKGSYEVGDKGTTANTVSNLTWNKDLAGAEEQTLTIASNDSSGGAHAVAIVLAAASGVITIDDAITEINAQLQASNDPTLQKITAVRVNDSGEKINFVSTSAFSVSVGNQPASSSGLGGTVDGVSVVGKSVNALQIGSSSAADISTAAGAKAAVLAISNAVKVLGTAQAAVGKGQNQLNYAVGLANSQIGNFSSAQAQIRDADVAAEAANLTKASVLQQASIAAMAQANSAPQAVLSLLK